MEGSNYGYGGTGSEGYDVTQVQGGQTTMGNGNGYKPGGGYDDEGQRTVRDMTADLRNALSSMRVTNQGMSNANSNPIVKVSDATSGRTSFDDGSNSDIGSSSSHTGSRSRSGSMVDGLQQQVGARVGDGDGADGVLDAKNYEKLAHLGEGAGGAVEKVKDKRTGQVLAMKVSSERVYPHVCLVDGKYCGVDHPYFPKPRHPQTTPPRTTIPQPMPLSIHRRSLRFLPHLLGYLYRDPHGTLRSRLRRHFGPQNG